ncbi:YjbQ family protein [Starkeya sp. ORNL1]|uniref:secondary thiamine-phosphate synthase enzyme YjbQ n=1 Tax=Starkeya sp. ORNL1 TaxID=2709380 RepID=UPI001463A3A6|nr:secondary thiamine-phosphate synthase enzyme YjbQ [Starkeya sp. ORNL1]QJP15117.1 YjbQ family protein [Starkeya sp. ORNL1]
MARINRSQARETRITRRVTATFEVATSGAGFTELTGAVVDFLKEIRAGDGEATLFCRHTSASLTIQENADPDVRTDLLTALRHLAPEDFGWVHDLEGPDDMPAHVKTMLTGVSLAIPVIAGRMTLGTWQGIYLIEHRTKPHVRQLIVAFAGNEG